MTTIAEKYSNWLTSDRPAPAELMTGLKAGFHHLRLDAEGLKSRDWTDLPRDWTPPDGELWAGGYLEDRSIYDSEVFKGSGEHRTLHLGLDVFAPAGTAVFAPVEGYVHSFQANGGALDYGPTIILQHEMPGLVFWTLYGHLTEESLFGLDEGDLITAGEMIGELGDTSINGGWAPHVHFQVILDIQGRRGDFPGVCALSEKEKWVAISPDPYAFLGVSAP